MGENTALDTADAARNRLVLDLPTPLLAAAEMAVIELVRFDAGHGHLKELLTLAEAASSCAIDGIQANARDVAATTLGPAPGIPEAEQIRSTALAVTRTERGQPMLSVQGFVELNRTITQATPEADSPHLEPLAKFLGRADVPVLVQAAEAYARFAVANPFTRANGRTGRALMLAMLRSAGVTGESVVPISAGLINNPRSEAARTAHRHGNSMPIIELCIEAIFKALDNSLLLAKDITAAGEIHRQLLGSTRSPAAAGISASLHRSPAVNAATTMAALGVSESAAYRALDQLTAAGILEPAPKVAGKLTWVAPHIVAALDAFLARATR